MKSFPDESQLPRSEDGSEAILGGSIGLNRILGRFVEHSKTDNKPEFTAVLINARTVFRNVYQMLKKDPSLKLDDLFVKDIGMFLEYYDTYLSFVRGMQLNRSRCPVVVYFPDYRKVPEEVRRPMSPKDLEEQVAYDKFARRFAGEDSLMQTLEHVECFWVIAGGTLLPHQDLIRKFKNIAGRKQCGYHSGDNIALISHLPVDFHLCERMRGICTLESHTGKLKSAHEFRLRLDEDGRVPFNTTTHIAFGDSRQIKPMFVRKQKHDLLEQADRERWASRSEEDIRQRIAKAAGLSLKDLRKYDFV